MKKITQLLITLLTLICLCACSNNNTNINTNTKNELAPLFEQGYEVMQTTFSENKWQAIIQKDGSFLDAYKVSLDMNQETSDKLFELGTFEEESKKQYQEILENLPGCVITSLNDEIPSDEEFAKYIGKTIKDLEDDGYERNGYSYDEQGCTFFADGPKYSVNIQTEEIITSETIDDYSENDIRALTIKNVEFSGFSFSIFE